MAPGAVCRASHSTAHFRHPDFPARPPAAACCVLHSAPATSAPTTTTNLRETPPARHSPSPLLPLLLLRHLIQNSNAQELLPTACCVDTDRIGAGCSSGGCGGYTPSGWNRLLTLHSLECDDPCCPIRCPPPPCTCSCVEDDCGTCCTCCVKQKPRRKRKFCVFTCDPKIADENESAMLNRPSSKILGELAFQLERRILDYVFGLEGSKRRRFYGYTVGNIHQMIEKESKTYKGEEDPVRKAELELRLSKLLQGLKQAGYNVKMHGDFAQQMINRYGLLSCPPDSGTVEDFGLQNGSCISKLIPQLARGEHEATKFQVLLRALQYLSKLDGAPLFVW